MWMILQQALGGATAASSRRRKLQKENRDKSVVVSSEDICDEFQVQCGAVVLDDKIDDDVMTKAADRELTQPLSQPRGRDITTTTSAWQPQDAPIINIPPDCSVHSFSIYPLDEMALDILKRTRAKTPCFWVGQLDPQPCDTDTDTRFDSAVALACEYQALLPERTFTPCPETQQQGPERTIRKIKGRQSLRDIAETDELGVSIHSDCETLVGWETPPWPLSPTSEYFPREKSPLPSLCFDSRSSNASSRASSPSTENYEPVTGFQACLDLLTEQLAAGLFKKHPTEHLDRASGLQILLMIEAYESVLLHVRSEMCDPRMSLSQLKLRQLADMEETLDHWLRSLYAIYERTRSNASNASFRSCRSSFSNVSTLPPLPVDR